MMPYNHSANEIGPNWTSTKNTTQLGRIQLSVENICQLTLYVNILVIGCVGNILVILYFGFKKKVKQRFSHYLINLALVDLLNSVLTPFNFIYTIVFQGKWHIGLFSCVTILSLGPLTVNVSAWIITSIAIERHRGIKNPLQQRYSRVQIYITMLIIWIISVLTLIPYMLSISIKDMQCRPHWSDSNIEFTYSLVQLLLQSIVPAFMMVAMFISIYKAITKRSKFLSAEYTTPATLLRSTLLRIRRPTSIEKKENTQEKRDKKLFNMLIIALILFIVCSMPYNIFYPTVIYLVLIEKSEMVNRNSIAKVNVWLSALVTANSCINFFIYAGMDKSFKKYCKSIVCRNAEMKNDNEKARRGSGARTSLTSRLSLYFDSEGSSRRCSSIKSSRRNSSNRSSIAHYRTSLFSRLSLQLEQQGYTRRGSASNTATGNRLSSSPATSIIGSSRQHSECNSPSPLSMSNSPLISTSKTYQPTTTL